MIKLLVLLLTTSLLCSALVQYDDYKVIRLNNLSNKQIQELTREAVDRSFDVWATSNIDGWMDIMIPPNAGNVFQGYDKEMRIPNVQEHINQSIVSNPNPNPLADKFFENFQTYPEINKYLADLVKDHPSLVKSGSIGKTYQGNDILSYVLTRGPTSKPAILIQCTIHAREWITTPVCCYLINQLLTNSTRSQYLDQYEWHIVPVFNVDGFLYTRSGDRLWRKNRQPNAGSTCIGTDLNRNYPFQWSGPGASNNPCSDTFYGSAKASAPEIVAITKYAESLAGAKKLRLFVDTHSYGGYILSAWGYTSTLPPDYNSAMLPLMKNAQTAVKASRGITYTIGASGPTLYPTSGSSVDYIYGTLRVPYSLTFEAAGSSFTPPTTDILKVAYEISDSYFSMATYLRTQPNQ